MNLWKRAQNPLKIQTVGWTAINSAGKVKRSKYVVIKKYYPKKIIIHHFGTAQNGLVILRGNSERSISLVISCRIFLSLANTQAVHIRIRHTHTKHSNVFSTPELKSSVSINLKRISFVGFLSFCIWEFDNKLFTPLSSDFITNKQLHQKWERYFAVAFFPSTTNHLW